MLLHCYIFSRLCSSPVCVVFLCVKLQTRFALCCHCVFVCFTCAWYLWLCSSSVAMCYQTSVFPLLQKTSMWYKEFVLPLLLLCVCVCVCDIRRLCVISGIHLCCRRSGVVKCLSSTCWSCGRVCVISTVPLSLAFWFSHLLMCRSFFCSPHVVLSRMYIQEYTNRNAGVTLESSFIIHLRFKVCVKDSDNAFPVRRYGLRS